MAAWRSIDAWILRITRAVLFVLGLVFVAAVSAEVTARLFLEVSIYFVHSLTLFLLVWFFLLGAGLALREGAHVGFDLVVAGLSRRARAVVSAVNNVAVLAFFVIMIWSGLYTLEPALTQVDSSLGLSTVWVMIAFPIGFLLLLYHQIAQMLLDVRGDPL